MKKNSWLAKVVADEDGQTVLIFPEELIKAMNLIENEILNFTVESNGNIVITRPKFVDTSSKT